jgi:hypothetical protein
MRRAVVIGGACCALCAACASAWTMSVRAHLQQPMSAACVEQTLVAQQIVDTTRIVPDRLGATAAQGLPHDSAGGSYAEVAFAAAGSRGRIVQTRDARGDPIVTLSWTWSETLPADDSVNVVEDWLLAYLDATYGECVGGTAGPEDVVVLRTWTLPDTAR